MNQKTTKVLLLDDDPNLRGVLSDILKAKGFEPVPAETGAAALTRIEQQDIDVALIDVKLEDKSGLEVLRGIKVRSPETECIMLTGYASQATAIDAVNLGAYSYFQKPYAVDQLLVAIQRATEKHAAAHAIQESEARFRSLIENSSDLIAILNSDATLRYVSPSIERLLGYSIEEVVGGTGIQDYIHPDDLPAFMEAFHQCIRASDSSPVSMQLRIRHKDGTWRTLEGTGSNLLDHPAIGGIVINARDVTERMQAQESVRLAEANYRLIFENASVGIFQSASDGRFLRVNPILASLYGYDSPDDMLTSVNDMAREIYVDPSERQEFQRLLAERGEVVEFICQNYRKDGSLIWTTTNAHFVKDAGGNILYYEGFTTDITGRKRTEAERNALLEIMQGLAATENLQEFLQLIQRAISKMIYAENFFVIFHNKSTGLFEEFYSLDKYDAPMPPSKLERSITSYVFRTGEPLLLTEAGFDELEARGEVERVGTKQLIWLGVPLKTPTGTIGVMAVQNYEDPDCYSERDREFLASVGVQVALAIERKQSEEKVKESEARYRSLFEDSPISLWEEDFSAVKRQLDGLRKRGVKDFRKYFKSHPQVVAEFAHLVRLLDVNKATLELYRAGSKTELLKNLALIFSDESYVQFREELILVAEGKTQFNWEGVNQTLDGRRLDINLSFAVAPEHESDLSKVIISVMDVTERKRGEQTLAESEIKFRWLYEYAPSAYHLLTPDGTITDVNHKWCELLGYRREEVLGRAIFDFVVEEEREAAKASFEKKKISRLPYVVGSERNYKTKDGVVRTFKTHDFFLLDQRQNITSVQTTIEDITERRQAEEALRQAEAKYHNIFENSIEGIYQSTLAGKFSTVNPALARMLGYASPEELIAGMTDLNRKLYVQPGRREEFMKQLSEHGTIVNFESEVYQRDGGTIWISENAQAMRDHSGQILYYEGTLKDITDRKQAEEEIRRRVADLVVLYENGLNISILLEPRKIARKMIEILSQKLDWHHAVIYLYYPETRRLELLALSEPGLSPAQIQVEIDRLNKTFASTSMGFSGWVIKHGRAIRSGNVQADKRYFSAFPGINSGLYAPLMIGERAIGSIAVESREANRFTESDQRLLQTLAAQSAIAFENARLYQEAVTAANRKAALHQGGLEIVRAGQDIEALCLALHHAARQVMPAEAFTVSLLTEDGLAVEAPYLFERGIRHPNTRLPVTAGITGRVIKSKKPLRIKNVQKSRGVKPIMVGGREPTRSILAVPLLAQDKIIGVLSAQSWEPDAYTNEDQIFLETLASEAAVAFENARLFEEVRRRLIELESLSQVSASLISVIDLAPLLENILAGARKAIPSAEKGTIFLTEPDGALHLHSMSGYTDPRLIDMVLPDQQGYVTRVARERNPIKIDDAHAGYEVPGNGTIEEIDAVQSGIAVPLIVKGKVIGVISLDNASRKAAFTDSDLRLLVTFASSAAVAIENARLFTETQQRLHRLSTLHSIDAAIGASVDIHVTLSIVLEHIMSELKADAAAVLMFNPLTRMLEYTAGRGFRVHIIEGLRLRLGEGLAGQSALQRRTINITDLQQANAMDQVLEHPVSGSASLPLQYLEGENFVSYHAIPLIAKGQVQGVLEIFKRTPMQVDQEWITFSEMLAGQTAIAIDNGSLFENLQHSNLELTLAYDATIQGWSQALELRDEETQGHTRRVTDLTLRLMQAMGIEEVEMEHARRGALLHDIGKIGIPDSILLKADPLDEREWKVMCQHPQYAHDLLTPIAYLRPALPIPWCHHENWDGSGYPRGLKGEEIPVVARIFAIVDVYDALTSNRPYRLAWTRENTLDYIREQSGKHFEPKVVTAFVNLITGQQ